ncbi:MAG: formate hydrogenlyase [Gammaproteobacteria bacterium]|nr:MAG: formate hydrogenlyase [Gammaproteobacteria bacterium]
MAGLGWQVQAVLVMAALVLFTSFVLLAQVRLASAIHAFAWQGVQVAAVAALMGSASGSGDLYLSAALTVVLKGLLIPWMLHRLVRRLRLEGTLADLARPAATLLLAAALVIFSYWLVTPLVRLQLTATGNIVAVSLAVVLIGLLMMIARRHAVTQVLGFMSLENGLFLAAISTTHGMPMVVELGVAFDVLVAAILFGVFFFQIRESIESLDVDRLSRLSEAEEEGR